jgi:hypothetical protein
MHPAEGQCRGSCELHRVAARYPKSGHQAQGFAFYRAAAPLHYADKHSTDIDWTACRMRLHVTCTGYGTCGPFGHTPAPYAGLSASGFAVPWRTAEAMDFVYVVADVPHRPVNLSDSEDAQAIIARTDAYKQESVELYKLRKGKLRVLNPPARVALNAPGRHAVSAADHKGLAYPIARCLPMPGQDRQSA